MAFTITKRLAPIHGMLNRLNNIFLGTIRLVADFGLLMNSAVQATRDLKSLR